METPTTTTPLDANSRCSLWKLGRALMHGTHHVAEKLTTATLPARSIGLPSREVRESAGPAAGAAAPAAPLWRNERNSAVFLVRPGNVAITFSSGSRMA